jgi:hypothetical protein
MKSGFIEFLSRACIIFCPPRRVIMDAETFDLALTELVQAAQNSEPGEYPERVEELCNILTNLYEAASSVAAD